VGDSTQSFGGAGDEAGEPFPPPASPAPSTAPTSSAFGPDDADATPFGDLGFGGGEARSTRVPPSKDPTPEAAADPFENLDPFAGLDVEEGAEAAPFASSEQASPPPATAPISGSPGQPLARIALTRSSGAAPASAAPEASPAPPPRGGLRLSALALPAEVALLGVLVAMAVSLGRGGDVSALPRFDLQAAFATGSHAALVPLDVAAARRTLANGADVLVVTGFVENRGATVQPAALVTVRVGAKPASGWAWNEIDGVALATVPDLGALRALCEQVPAAPALAPGAKAPFVVVAADDDAPVEVQVAAVAPPIPRSSGAP
jgi:hypothetical protein